MRLFCTLIFIATARRILLNTFFIVADLWEFLELDHDLEDPKCSSTIEFIHNIHRIFDILNSRHASAEAVFFTSY